MNEAQRLNKSIKKEPQQAAMGARSIGYATNWAWRIRFIPANLKLLLVALASQANANGIADCPVRWLADHCNTNIRHTQKLLLRLEQIGLIVIQDRAPGTPDRSRLFFLQVTIDADTWQPAPEVHLMRHAVQRRGGTVTDTKRFYDAVLATFPDKLAALEMLTNRLGSFRVLAVVSKRLVLRVPHQDAADAIYRDYKALFLRVASELAKSDIKKIQVIHRQGPPDF